MREYVLSHENRQWWMGLAMIWIIVYHLWISDGGLKSYINIDFLDFFFSKGYLGVDIFFFLSAYGCACSLSKNSLRTFYRNRFFRLFPIYIVYTIILVLILCGYYRQTWWLMFVKQVTGLSTLTLGRLQVEWYMPAQILVYVLFPIIYKLAKMIHKNAVSFFLVVLFFSIFVFVIDRIFISNFAYRIPIIIIGTVTYFLLAKNNNQRLLLYYLMGGLIAFLSINSVILFSSLTLPLLLYAFSKCDLHLPLKRGVSFIGKHSLEIYLAQNFALDHFLGKMSVVNPLVKFFECAMIIILGSCLLYYIQFLSSKFLKNSIL